MLREPRCLREVFETSRRVYGDSDSTPTRWGEAGAPMSEVTA